MSSLNLYAYMLVSRFLRKVEKNIFYSREITNKSLFCIHLRLSEHFATQEHSKIKLLLEKNKSIKVGFVCLFKNALNRLRNAAPRTDFYKHKHEDCENFDNGTCKYFHFTNLNPKETACPHFKPKQKNQTNP